MPVDPAIPLRAWGGELHWFHELDSTNRYALDAAASGAPAWFVVAADHQTAGRGRLGRVWQAPSGSSLLASVLLRPTGVEPARRPVLGVAGALAAAEAVEATTGVVAALKWPNDLVVGERKLGGVLAEARGDALVIGVGVNVEWSEVPPELEGIATACNLEGGRPVQRRALLAELLVRLRDRVDDLDRTLRDHRYRLATLGRRVRVERADGDLIGRAVDVDHFAQLLVEVESGCVVEVAAGDVVHLRDAR